MKKTTKTEAETQKMAETLAKEVLSVEGQPGACVVALVGDLGAGKTVFVRGFAKALGVKEKITSPTFVILKSYKLQAKSYKLLVHIDAYRLDNPEEMEILGWSEAIKDPKNIILIEWAEKIEKILPKPYFLVNFSHNGAIRGEHSRTIDIKLIK